MLLEVSRRLTKEARGIQEYQMTMPKLSAKLHVYEHIHVNDRIGNRGAQNRAGNANDKMLLMQAQGNGAVLDEEELLFLAGEQANTFDVDVDNQPIQDLALNEVNNFQADECDAFDSDVDNEPTAQSIFMANLSSAGPANPQVGPSNASILSEVHILENAINHSVTNQAEHEIHNEVQQANAIDSTSVNMGNSNVIPYEQYFLVDNISVLVNKVVHILL
ncbi:hypothetical protein Tco_0484626 [Tanacetum coccineum]